MTDKPINLRQARKRRARETARQKADQNAVTHGRSKTEKSNETARRAAEIRKLDGHLREDG